MGRFATVDQLMNVGLGFWASKTLLSAVELELFTVLAKGPRDQKSLERELGLHPRSSRDFFDALVALGFLQRPNGKYQNTPTTHEFLDKEKSTYVGGMLEMANARLYGFWDGLTDGLRTGQAQNEAKRGDAPFFETLYAEPDRLSGFLSAMTGISRKSNISIASKFPWGQYKTAVDVGTAQGDLIVQVALAHKHITGGGFDLPKVGPIFEDYVAGNNLSGRLGFTPGSFFDDDFPKADVITMGHILHDWDLDEKKMLLRKAHEAVPDGGAVIVYESLIDDDRSRNAFGLLMSLNMLIETSGGFDFTGGDCMAWMREAGFRETRVEHLHGPDSMVIGIK
jgi:O-methyltransferase/methyltransferase family protein